ncbi:hypothetical protein H6794_01280 [Candidatus Nomurabacteria bacterium]|nr:hypothetical protein [Candidatus Nomurabacteria bacterium]
MTKEEKTKPKTNQPQPEASQIPAVKKKRKKSKGPLIYTVILVLALSFGTFFFVRYQQVNNKYQDLVMSEEDKVREVVQKVSKLYDIPTFDQEKPKWTFIKDQAALDKIKEANDFFKNAKVNDVLLAYEKADLAILFRPSDNKIVITDSYKRVAVTPVNIAIIAPTDKQSSTEKTIKEKATNAVIISKTTPKGTITQGVVVDVSGKEKAAAEKIASFLGLQVGNLPEGESPPEGANFVVVLPNASPTTQAPQE